MYTDVNTCFGCDFLTMLRFESAERSVLGFTIELRLRLSLGRCGVWFLILSDATVPCFRVTVSYSFRHYLSSNDLMGKIEAWLQLFFCPK